ncbi:phosphotransferase family protein [Apiospora sp. TS-2023a]
MMVPIPGVIPFPEEKTRYEVATMRYVAAHTTTPVPHIYHHGTAAENPSGLGPFIIMDYIDHHQNMSRELLDPAREDQRAILDPNVSEEKLELLYGQMANILLQLSNLKFPLLGSLVDEKVVHNDAPASILPSKTYTSSNEWYRALADLHMAQLALQHNSAVEDEDDARDKYVARQLFRNLAAKNRLFPYPAPRGGVLNTANEEFRLFSEDLRPANVLLDKDLRVVGVIDWEFAYAAPAQFSYDPPWWLLVREPEDWPGGYRPFMEIYEPRLRTFLRVLEREEGKMEEKMEEKKRASTEETSLLLLDPRT